MLRKLNLDGNPETGKGAFLTAQESPDQAFNRLLKLAVSDNLDALYMMGIIKSYCHNGSQFGISILNHASCSGCPRSSYALGLILRDISKHKSKQYLEDAAKRGYLPAWQELLSAFEMRRRYGDLEAGVLKKYLDPFCLNRFLGNHYLGSSDVRKLQTSHCWNPLCGRWAFRASANPGRDSTCFSQNKTVKQLHSLLLSGPQLKSRLEWLLHQQRINRNISDSIELVQFSKSSKDQKCSAGILDSTSSQNELCYAEIESCNSDTSDVSSFCSKVQFRVSRMKMCSSCRRAKYCSKLCQVYDWRSGRHKMECQFL